MPESWTPTVEQVHAEIPTRNNGAAFDASSYPTAAQVSLHITTAATIVTAEVGLLPDYDAADDRIVRIYDMAEIAARKKAASSIEYKHFPEQNNPLDDSGEGAALYAEYRQVLDALKLALAKYRGRNRRQIHSVPLRPSHYDDASVNLDAYRR